MNRTHPHQHHAHPHLLEQVCDPPRHRHPRLHQLRLVLHAWEPWQTSHCDRFILINNDLIFVLYLIFGQYGMEHIAGSQIPAFETRSDGRENLVKFISPFPFPIILTPFLMIKNSPGWCSHHSWQLLHTWSEFSSKQIKYKKNILVAFKA